MKTEKDISKIITGISSLYSQGLISYSPAKEHIEMIFGTNTLKYASKYKISLQKKDAFEVGKIEIDGEWHYCPERLFIELNKFSMESTVKNEAIKNLIKTINPYLVKKYYNILRKRRRGLDNEMIETFLEKNLLNINEKIKEAKDKKVIIREYLMALVSTKKVPISLIKGGSAVELFTDINRSTLDVDAHTSNNSIDEIIKFLCAKEKEIYFKLLEKTSEKLLSKKVVKLTFIPVSKGGTLSKELKNIKIPISFNTTYDENELKKIIKTYKITSKNLRHFRNTSCLIFSREMLLAEKFQSIISKPTSTTRTKDLIDLKLLWSDNINFNKFRKWFFRKWANQRYPLSEHNAILEEVQKNQGLPLTKIKNNFDDASKMYDQEISFSECFSIYKILIFKILNF